jgi:hypothetical protein
LIAVSAQEPQILLFVASAERLRQYVIDLQSVSRSAACALTAIAAPHTADDFSF